jgi:hypothetical protein
MLKRVRNGSFCHFSFFFSRNIIKGGTAAVPPCGGGTTLSPNPDFHPSDQNKPNKIRNEILVLAKYAALRSLRKIL